MDKNSRRRTREQRPATSNVRSLAERQPKTKGLPQGERTSLDDDWVAASVTELSPKDEIDLEVVKRLIDEALSRLPAPKDGIDLETVKQLIDEALSIALAVSPQQQRKRGPKARWRLMVAGEACTFYQKHGRYATAKELIELCQDKVKDLLPKGRVLDDSSIYQLLRYLGAE
jgi:hypothetical protein